VAVESSTRPTRGKSEDKITSEERKLGKALNFALLYGASAHTFKIRARVDYGLDISLDEAQRFHPSSIRLTLIFVAGSESSIGTWKQREWSEP
jgi:hypothetical protein